jgi:hypothetical protein
VSAPSQDHTAVQGLLICREYQEPCAASGQLEGVASAILRIAIDA